ncbi:MAG: UDP-N-acetylglucosamine 2-epimerase (non-hydrolyzing) [Acidobacteriota bacterium]
MLKILSIFGTRPEAIKMAPVVKELKKNPERIESVVCVTAQHREMLDQVLDLFMIKPDIDLDLMENDQTPASLTSLGMMELTRVLQNVKPDLVLVQGDTTTAMVAALAAFYQKIPVGHVEAGLRTKNIYAPFPEEVNRHIIGVLGKYHFAPTRTAARALLAENVPEENIFITGNTVIDALLWTVQQEVPRGMHPLLAGLENGNRLILITAHRRENFGEPFLQICRALCRIAERNSDVSLIYPVHRNPNVRQPVYRMLSRRERIHLVDPMGYAPFAHLMKKAYLVLTDSGGIQEEAPALGKPVLVMRKETERPEAVEAGTVKVVGLDEENIVRETEKLLYDHDEYKKMAQAVNPYGDGHAAERIVKILMRTDPS